jgi:hypothetical protein
MLELSLHILDIAENSTRAGAKEVSIMVKEDPVNDVLLLEVKDDGQGMSSAARTKALDPFYTTKKARRIGLGLPMLAEAAERTGGRLILESQEGVGTRVTAVFGLSHIDRQPLGNIVGTMVTLIAGNADADFIYHHQRGEQSYTLDTREIREMIDDVPINHSAVLHFIRNHIDEGLTEIKAEA